MAELVLCMPCNYGDLSSIPRTHTETKNTPGMVGLCSCNPSTGEAGAGGCLGLVGQVASLVSSRAVRDLRNNLKAVLLPMNTGQEHTQRHMCEREEGRRAHSLSFMI